MTNKIKLNFEGKEFEFFFGLPFMAILLEEKEFSLEDIFNSVNSKPYSFIPFLMFESYKHTCKRKGISSELDLSGIENLIEQTGYFKDGSESAKFIEPFLQSIIDSLPKVEGEKADGVKKK